MFLRFLSYLANLLTHVPAMRIPYRWVSGFATGTLVVASFFATSAAQSTDSTEQFFQGLRERQLHRLAVAYGEDVLQRQDLSPTLRVTFTLELMQTHADWARQLSDDARRSEYAAAHEMARSFQQDSANAPRAILIDVQDALIDLSAGRVLRMEREVGRANEANRDEALNYLRSAIRKLEALDKTIEEAIPQAFRSPPNDEGLRGEQLMALRQRVRFQRGLALQNQAMLFARDDRLNRIDALSEVIREMEELAGTVPSENALWWQAQLERAESLRLLSRFDECRQLLASLPEDSPPAALDTAAVVQRTRLLLAEGQAETALRDAWTWREAHSDLSPELDLEILTAMLTLADQAEPESDALKRWQDQAVAMSREIASRHGPFWGRRANLELVGKSDQQPQIGNVDILLQLGDENYLKGQFDEALQAYERAAEEAARNNRISSRFDARRKAGLLLQQLQRFPEAAQSLAQIALEIPDHELAAGTYLQAAWNQSQAARSDASLIPAYSEMLERCIQQWPESESADQARLWLGKIYEFQQKWTAAVEVYLEVNLASDRFVEAVQLAQTATRQALATNDDATERTRIANTLASTFANRLPPDEDGDWSEAEIQVALEAARLMLLHGENRERRAGEILRRVLDANDLEQPSIRSEIAALLLVESLQGGSSQGVDANAQTAEQLKQIENAPTDRLLDVASTLARIQSQSATSPNRSQSPLAETLLTLTSQLLNANRQLTESQRLQVLQYQAAAWAATGKYEQAIGTYRELLTDNPRSGEILESLAQALAESPQTQDQKESLTRWRQLAQGSKPHTDRWFLAKYETARMMEKLGQRDEAMRLLRFIKETPPGWEQAPNRDALEALLRRLQ